MGCTGVGFLRLGKMRLATKDHIEHIEYDGEMHGTRKEAAHRDGSPYLGPGLLQVGMSVPAHPRGRWGLLVHGVLEDG